MDDRLIAIEERMAHLERILDEASAEILRQDRLIDGLGRRIQRLEARLAEFAAGIDDGSEPGTPFLP
ncbi:SlyX family protein [uncultured Tistrella sp.]|uniref:SlyX family protein n=1 Tax=Tistrella mobilis TaxID=171437 RepID=UPI000C08E2FD|nr:SlyX family protein [uncultured Tistrella sp.]MAM76321.1 SlyX protein [Tistrella sp.]